MPNKPKISWNPFSPTRRKTRIVHIGGLAIGGDFPIAVQSMTNTNTRDVAATVKQSLGLQEAGCELVRITAPVLKDAQILGEIAALFHKEGGVIPLCADIHFQPKAAFEALKHVEKVRINPGNFADKGIRHLGEMTQEEFDLGSQKVADSFGIFVREAQRLGRAIRIGTNHGSLGSRMLWKYGDSIEGMVESALEYLNVCEAENFHDIVFSMKSSNPKVAIQAYRLLADRLDADGRNYPFHVGVTEAGEGEDGRLKSAVGIGALLLDGIGDTIRVSLTEDPVREIPVAQKLIEVTALPEVKEGSEFEWKQDRFHYSRRKTKRVDLCKLSLGGDCLVAVGIKSCAGMKVPTGARALEFFEAEKAGDILQGISGSVAFGTPGGCWRRIGLVELPEQKGSLSDQAVEIEVRMPSMLSLIDLAKLPTGPRIWTVGGNEFPLGAWRRLVTLLNEAGLDDPILLKLRGGDSESERLRLAAWGGALFCDGIGDALLTDLSGGSEESLTFAYDLLQVCGLRRTKTEFISCPSCGRTLFDLEDVTAQIKKRTGHLQDVSIAVMGCIVNGPGEMAGADFGYVGGAPGKVHLYVGQEAVRKNVPEAEATDALIELIREHGRWQEV